MSPRLYDASAGTSASRRPKAGRRSALLNARSIAQNDAWFVVTMGFLNSRSQEATDDMVGKLPPGHHEGLDLRPIDPGESITRVLRAELPDRIRVGRAKSFESDRVE